MVCLWQATVDCNKAAYIAKSVRFYESGRKVLIFRICKDTSSGREDWRKMLKSAM